MGNSDTRRRLVPPGALLPFILLTSCFAWWGLANNMTDTLLAAFKRIKSLSDFQTSLIQIAFYGAYFCFALPAALYVRRFSYQSGVLLGLGLFIVGGLLFYPASLTMQYGHFLVALYILAGGLSILETSANPYIVEMGPPETGTQRLNLAQSFNPLGSILGVVISKIFILSQLQGIDAEQRKQLGEEALREVQSAELSAVMGPYVGVSAVLILVWLGIFLLPMPRAYGATNSDQNKISLRKSFGRLLRRRHYVFGVLAQFFYVGAQIGVWSFTIRYVMLELDLNENRAASYYLAALILFAGSRFLCTWLMNFFTPERVLTVMSLLAMVLTVMVITVGGLPGVLALVCISGCMSLMFPTIFGLSVRDLGPETRLAGSGLIMAIVGGAVLTALQGQVSDLSGSIRLSYWIPFLCFTVIAVFGGFSEYFGRKRKMILIAGT